MSQTNLPNSDDETAGRDAGGRREQFDFYVAELETYLDGELDAAEAAAVRGRLSAEPAYAAALDRLHAERLARAAAFDFIERGENDPAAADRLAAAARQLSLRARATGGVPRWAKIVGGMAACALIGFALGYAGGFDFGTPPAKPSPTPFAANSAAGTDADNAVPQSGWVRYEAGRPVLTLPEAGEADRPLRDPRHPQLPQLIPVDRTFEHPPR